jgi:hypothetical protein
MSAQVMLVRLITGEEIMGKVTESEHTISINKPVRIVIMPSKADPTTPTVGLAPWMEFAESKDFTIHKAHVVTIAEPIREFYNQYNSMFGGIVMPSSKLLLTE